MSDKEAGILSTLPRDPWQVLSLMCASVSPFAKQMDIFMIKGCQATESKLKPQASWDLACSWLYSPLFASPHCVDTSVVMFGDRKDTLVLLGDRALDKIHAMQTENVSPPCTRPAQRKHTCPSPKLALSREGYSKTSDINYRPACHFEPCTTLDLSVSCCLLKPDGACLRRPPPGNDLAWLSSWQVLLD